MQKQSPDRNNPANPLLKVAALQIDKKVSSTNFRQARVVASLNFKKSDDLHGVSEARGGKVVVSFGLALKRASLRIVFLDDIGGSLNGLVKIENVLFVCSLLLKKFKNHALEISQTSGFELTIQGDAAARTNALAVIPDGKVTAAAKQTRRRTKQSKTVLSERSHIVNVNATYAGNEIHWEINPGGNIVPDIDSYLEGEVFRPAGGEMLDACAVKREDGKSASTLCVTGSVYVNMIDLMITRIDFTDEFGTKINFNREFKKERKFHLSPFQEETKKRLLKQIIRKHLMDQGLSADGSLVEICRASA